MANLNLDVVIVGAGFSGCLSLHEFRKRGFNAKIIEAGDDLGGVWYWNHYPGVQVDSLTPLYQVTDPELWEDFSFTRLYPSGDEVLRYFEHLDNNLELRKDIVFGHRVISARYIDRQWQLQTYKGLEVTAPMIVWAVGTTNKQLFLQWKGLSSFKGQVIHAARWPKDFDPKGKRIGLVGQGSIGVQIVERLSKENCQSPSSCGRRPLRCLHDSRHIRKRISERQKQRIPSSSMMSRQPICHMRQGLSHTMIKLQTNDKLCGKLDGRKAAWHLGRATTMTLCWTRRRTVESMTFGCKRFVSE